VRRPLGDHPAFGHHDHPVADVLHHVHVVLDEQHGHALVAQVGHVPEQALRERRVHAGHRLVEHHHLRVASSAPAPSRAACAGRPTVPGQVLGHVVELEAGEQLVGGCSVDLAAPDRSTAGEQAPKKLSPRLPDRAELHVLDDGHASTRALVSWNVRTMP
jgi:hypothetical protein